MANTIVNGLIGFNPQTGGASRVLAAYENDIVNASGGGLGYGLAINTSNNVEFEAFLDRVFFQNYNDRPLTYKSLTDIWSTEYVGRTMLAKYLKKSKSRMFLGYCKFPSGQAPLDSSGNAIIFSSRVFYSDLFVGNTLTWGIDWGRNGKVSQGSNLFDLDLPFAQDFISVNIKVGDPLFITSGSTALSSDKPYFVTSVDSSHRLIVDRSFPVTATGLHFWVGSNYFDVGLDDGDSITGFGENNDRLLVSKLLSIYFYTGTQLRLITGAPGASSKRSIINDKNGNTYYFHGSDPNISGIYKYNGVSASLISRGIAPFIKGMITTNFPSVVAWQEGNELRWYLGSLTNTNYNISMTNAVATYNIDLNAFSIDPINDVIKVSTQYITSNQQDTYVGTDSSQVLKMNSGNAFKTLPIPATLETKVYYPAGSELICSFPTLQIIGRFLRGVRLKYKLWGVPVGNQKYSSQDDYWFSLGELEGDLTELPFPLNHQQGAGIQFKFEEMGSVENDFYVEKMSLFYRVDRSRLL